MKFLGIDYGKRKVGLAISEGLVASPLKVIEVSSLADAINKITHIIKAEGIDQVVVGIPESGQSLKMVKSFIKELGMNVHQVPETLSTHQALDKMIEMGTTQKARRQDDGLSAAIILQEFLDGHEE